EYAAQYLQILYGKDHPELRTTGTLDALDQLQRLGLISATEHSELGQAYLFLRMLIDALRIVRGDASDLILPEETSAEFKSLSRRLGVHERDWQMSAERLATDTRQCMQTVRSYYTSRFAH
ncbi:MAG: hypothetical protein ACRERV_18710, partial [Methylococcales bacterium]